MKSIELFAGAGGLALGSAMAGLEHSAVLEWDSHSCNALRHNIKRPDWKFDKWNVLEGDVRNYDFTDQHGRVDIVSGGPPCQPFSIGGKHKAFNDDRDMFPHAARVVAEVAPRAFIFENVRGLARESFKNYFQYITLRLTFPEEVIGDKEDWTDHLARLERLFIRGTYRGLQYRVLSQVLNAANFGIPQQRHRVFFVGFRSDVEHEWSFPKETHSEDSLVVSKWIEKDYWDEHNIARKNRPEMTDYEERRLSQMIIPIKGRWQTVRDAISDLPDPRSKKAEKISGHKFQGGARPYAGHTGSQYDMPAKTLKAGDHGVPGGENMLALPDGSYRYFTVRESARIQTFPDTYEFPSPWTESMRQIGNAVPVNLASIVTASVKNALPRETVKEIFAAKNGDN
ncbi:MAG: DNA cytosine methyltransferase [Pyrinomonadaceae bacterium]